MKCDYPACGNEREAGELYCISHNRKYTAFPTAEPQQAGTFDARAWLLANYRELVGPTSRFYPTSEDIRIAERAYAAGQAAAPAPASLIEALRKARSSGFQAAKEMAAHKVDLLMDGVQAGELMPSCENPILVSEGLRVLAEAIRCISDKES